MRKIFITLVTVSFFTVSLFSQLSTRENDATVLKLGSRPGSGDMALTFAYGFDQGGSADLPIANRLLQGDILTFKYYTSSGTAIRLGIKLYKDATSLKGDEDDDATDITKIEQRTSSREYIIAPGIEKHYNAANIFDVYAGADLYLGFKREVSVDNEERDDEFTNVKMTSNPLVAGLGGVVGFNVFIAQLPVSIGLEYGLNFKWTNEGKTKVKVETEVDTQEYFIVTGDLAGTPYSKLSASEFGINTNNNVRIVLNIYFGK